MRQKITIFIGKKWWISGFPMVFPNMFRSQSHVPSSGRPRNHFLLEF
jgi:hypothetical protein